MDWIDAEELAAIVLGIDYAPDSDTLEQAMYEKFDISLEQFTKVAEALMPFTIPAKVAISGEAFQGFVKNGAFICRKPVPNVVIEGLPEGSPARMEGSTT